MNCVHKATFLVLGSVGLLISPFGMDAAQAQSKETGATPGDGAKGKTSQPTSKPSSTPAAKSTDTPKKNRRRRAGNKDRKIKIIGTRFVPQKELLKLLGPGPLPENDARAWAERSIRRIVKTYRLKGYRYARGFWRFGKKGQIEIEIDEGKMQLVFVGAGTVRSQIFHVDLYLPGKIFHRPTLEQALAEFKKKYNLVNAYYRVTETRPLRATSIGKLVPQRQLNIYVISREFFGWMVKVEFSSTWGILPKVGYSHKGLLLYDDRFAAAVELGFPYRRYFFEESPAFQWVHGGADLSYRLPRFAGDRIAPLVDGATSYSRYARSTAELQSYFAYRAAGFANLQLLFPPGITIKIGGGIHFTRIFDMTQVPNSTAPLHAERSLHRYVNRTQAHFALDRGLLRRDQRNEMSFQLQLASSDEGEWFVDTRFNGQLVLHLGAHNLLFRSRGVFMAGDVRFWDEAVLAGDYLRAYFENRYWVRETFQLEAAFRFTLSRTVSLGVYHDGALFFDRTRDGPPLALANAFGPSLHFMLFDVFALDIYYAFGFAPVGFDHNFSFSLGRAF